MSSSGVNIEGRGVGGSDFNPWRSTFQEIDEEEVGVDKKAKESEVKEESKNSEDDSREKQLEKNDSPAEEESRLKKVLTPGERKYFEPPNEEIIEVVNILTQNLTDLAEKEDDKSPKSEILNNIYPKDSTHKVDKGNDPPFSKDTDENNIVENVFRASRGEIIKLDKKISARPKNCRTDSEQTVKKAQKSFINAADFCETIIDDNFGVIEPKCKDESMEGYLPGLRRNVPSSKTSKKNHHLSVLIQELSQQTPKNGVHTSCGFSNSRVLPIDSENCVLNLKLAKSNKDQEKNHINKKSKEADYLEQSQADFHDKLLQESSEKTEALNIDEQIKIKPTRRPRKNNPKKVSPKFKKTTPVEEYLINGNDKYSKNKAKVSNVDKPILNGKKMLNSRRSSGSNSTFPSKSLLNSQSISTSHSDPDPYEFSEETTLNDQTSLRFQWKAKNRIPNYQESKEAAEALVLLHGAPNSSHNEKENLKNKKRDLNDQAIMVNKENSFDLKEMSKPEEKSDPSIYEKTRNSKDTPRVRTRAQNIRKKEESLVEEKTKPSKKRWNNSIIQEDETLPKAIDLSKPGLPIKHPKSNEKSLKGRKSQKQRLSSKTCEDFFSSNTVRDEPDDHLKESKCNEAVQLTCVTLKSEPLDLRGGRKYSRNGVNKSEVIFKKNEVSTNKQRSRRVSDDTTKKDELISKTTKDSENGQSLDHLGTEDEVMKIIPKRETRSTRGRKCKKSVRPQTSKNKATDPPSASTFPATPPSEDSIYRSKEDHNSASFPIAQTKDSSISEVIQDPKPNPIDDVNLGIAQYSPVSDVDVTTLDDVGSTVEDCSIKETQPVETIPVKEVISTSLSQMAGDVTTKCSSWLEEHKNSFDSTSSQPIEKTDFRSLEMKTNGNVNSTVIDQTNYICQIRENSILPVTDKVERSLECATSDISLVKEDNTSIHDTSCSGGKEKPKKSLSESTEVNECRSTTFPPATPTGEIRNDYSQSSEADNSAAPLSIHTESIKTDVHCNGDKSAVSFHSTLLDENEIIDYSLVKDHCAQVEDGCEIAKEVENSSFCTAQSHEDNKEANLEFSTQMETEEKRAEYSLIEEITISTNENSSATECCEVKTDDSAFSASQPDYARTDVNEIQDTAFEETEDISTNSLIKENLNSITEVNEVIVEVMPGSCEVNDSEDSAFPASHPCEGTTGVYEIQDTPDLVETEDADGISIKVNLNSISEVNEHTTAAVIYKEKEAEHSSSSIPCEETRTNISQIQGDCNALPSEVDTEVNNPNKEVLNSGNESSELAPDSCLAKEAAHSSPIVATQLHENTKTDLIQLQDDLNPHLSSVESEEIIIDHCQIKDVEIEDKRIDSSEVEEAVHSSLVVATQLHEDTRTDIEIQEDLNPELSSILESEEIIIDLSQIKDVVKIEDKRMDSSQAEQHPNTSNNEVTTPGSCHAKEAVHSSPIAATQLHEDTRTDIEASNTDVSSVIESEEIVIDHCQMKDAEIEDKRMDSSQAEEHSNTSKNEVTTPGSCHSTEVVHSPIAATQLHEDTRTDIKVSNPDVSSVIESEEIVIDHCQMKDAEIEDKRMDSSQTEEHPNATKNEVTIAGSCHAKEVVHSPIAATQLHEDTRTDMDDLNPVVSSIIESEEIVIDHCPIKHVEIEEDKRMDSSQAEEYPNTSSGEVMTPGSCQAKEAEHSVFSSLQPIEVSEIDSTISIAADGNNQLEKPDLVKTQKQNTQECIVQIYENSVSGVENTEVKPSDAGDASKDIVEVPVHNLTVEKSADPPSDSKIGIEKIYTDGICKNLVTIETAISAKIDEKTLSVSEDHTECETIKEESKAVLPDENKVSSEASKYLCNYFESFHVSNCHEMVNQLKSMGAEKVQIISSTSGQNVDSDVRIAKEDFDGKKNAKNRSKKRCKPTEDLEEEFVSQMRKKRRKNDKTSKEKTKRKDNFPTRRVSPKEKKIPNPKMQDDDSSSEVDGETSFYELLRKHNISNFNEIANQFKALEARKNHPVESDSDVEIIEDSVGKNAEQAPRTIRHVFINLESVEKKEKASDLKFQSIYKPQLEQKSKKKQVTFQEHFLENKKHERKEEKRERKIMKQIMAFQEEIQRLQNNPVPVPFPNFPFGQPSTSTNFLIPEAPFMPAPFSRSHRRKENSSHTSAKFENVMPSIGSLPPFGFNQFMNPLWPVDPLPPPIFLPQGVQAETPDIFPHLTGDLPSFSRGFKRKQKSNPKEKKRRK